MNRAATIAGTVAVVLLAACGGDDGETTAASDTGSAEAGDTPAPDDGGAGEEAPPAEGASNNGGEATEGVPSDDPWCTNYIAWAEEFQAVLTEASGGGAPDTTTFMNLTASVKDGAPAEISADVTTVMDMMKVMVESMTGTPGGVPADPTAAQTATTRVLDFTIDYCSLDPDFSLGDIAPPPPG